jgi:hypothetical protein
VEEVDLFGVEAHREVVEVEEHVGLLDRLGGPAHALGLNLVGRVAKAGRVDEAEEHALNLGLRLNLIARGAGRFTDDGPVVPHQRVQQGRLARVGPPADDDAHAVLQLLARRVGVEQILQDFLGLVEQVLQAFPVGKLDVLVGKVDLQLHQRAEVEQLLAQLPQQI